MEFEWHPDKNQQNVEKHGVNFADARRAWLDPCRVVAADKKHSRRERRYFLFGKLNDAVLTVRFTRRGSTIRIIGAGYWREGKARYEELNRFRE